MNGYNLSEELNKFNINKVSFFDGNISNFGEMMKNKLPFQTLAIISTKEDFEKYGKYVFNFLKDNGNKVVNYIVSGELTLENLYGMFTLPENVRGVIAIGKVYDFAYYFASVRNIQTFIIPLSFDFYGILKNTLFIKNDGILDKMPIDIERNIFIDNSLFEIKGDIKADFYSFCVNFLPSLVEYRIVMSILGQQPNKTVYNLVRDLVKDMFNLLTTNCGDNKKYLYTAFSLVIADNMSGDKLTFSNSNYIACLLYGDTSPFAMLTATKKILNLYNAWFSSNLSCVTSIVDYNERAEEVVKITNLDIDYVNDCMLFNCNILNSRRLALEQIKNKLKGDIINLEKVVNSIYNQGKNLYKNPVKVDDEKLIKAINLAGDTPYSITGMTYLREYGVLELLK